RRLRCVCPAAREPARTTLFPYTTLFRSWRDVAGAGVGRGVRRGGAGGAHRRLERGGGTAAARVPLGPRHDQRTRRPGRDGPVGEIGRASCRERVWGGGGGGSWKRQEVAG